MTLLQIENNGPEIVATNYWETEHARSGLLFLSINAGAFRLLIPASQESQISEMKTATEVVISRGPWPYQGKHDALEILFEDNTDDPFCIHLVPEQCDRMPTTGARKSVHTFALWTSTGKRWECPAYYRIVKHLPWLKPRSE